MILYLIRNAVNGKCYVGITSRTVTQRFNEHLAEARQGKNRLLLAAIRKYGAEEFSVLEIDRALDWASLCEKEKHYIRVFGTKAPGGYNLTGGGDGAFNLDADIIRATAEKNRGRRHTPEALKKISDSSRGRAMSDSTKKKLSDAHKGKRLSVEHRAKLARAKVGKKQDVRSAEHSRKISEGLKRAWARRKADAL